MPIYLWTIVLDNNISINVQKIWIYNVIIYDLIYQYNIWSKCYRGEYSSRKSMGQYSGVKTIKTTQSD